MNNRPRLTRQDIRSCVWSNSSVRCATAYRAAFGFLKNSGADIHAHKAIRDMMRYHAKDAIFEARLSISKPDDILQGRQFVSKPSTP
tara:strand:+ start:319 stop:579 length:261 start_codon:yes stop_codon:yes gene_type:complete